MKLDVSQVLETRLEMECEKAIWNLYHINGDKLELIGCFKNESDYEKFLKEFEDCVPFPGELRLVKNIVIS